MEEFFSHFDNVFIEEHIYTTEFLQPKTLQDILPKLGLQLTQITSEELIESYRTQKYCPKLSVQDCMAYAVCKSRNWVLLTGDNRLKKHAMVNGVEVHGIIWVIQELYTNTNAHLIAEAIRIALKHPRIRISRTLFVENFPEFFDDNNELIKTSENM